MHVYIHIYIYIYIYIYRYIQIYIYLFIYVYIYIDSELGLSENSAHPTVDQGTWWLHKWLWDQTTFSDICPFPDKISTCAQDDSRNKTHVRNKKFRKDVSQDIQKLTLDPRRGVAPVNLFSVVQHAHGETQTLLLAVGHEKERFLKFWSHNPNSCLYICIYINIVMHVFI